MAEGIETPQGEPLNIDPNDRDQIEAGFARAMSEPAGDDKAPPRRAERKQEPSREQPRVKRGPGRPRASEKPPVPVPGLSKAARVEGVKGLVQLGATGCLLVSKGVAEPHKTACMADAVTLASSADQLAAAVADVCDTDERFARIVDKVCSAGPYSALVAVGFQIGTQIARNHGAPIPGTHAPEDLIAMSVQQQEPVPQAA